MNKIVPEARKDLVSTHIAPTPYGLKIEGQPSLEEWSDAMKLVQGGELLMQWYKADLAACAESITTGWGESKYDNLADKFDNSTDTLKDLASVARRFSLSFREKLVGRTPDVFSLSMSHFKTVMGMADEYAEYFLVKAAENRWGRDRLREEIIRSKNNGQLPEPRMIEEWRKEVRSSLTRIYDSEPEIIEIRSIRNGEVVATETIEIN